MKYRRKAIKVLITLLEHPEWGARVAAARALLELPAKEVTKAGQKRLAEDQRVTTVDPRPSVRLLNACARAGVETLADLAFLGERGLRGLKDVGQVTLNEAGYLVERAGLKLQTWDEGRMLDETAPITELDLTVRAFNVLEGAGYSDIKALKGFRFEDIVGFRNGSVAVAREIQLKLTRYGHRLR